MATSSGDIDLDSYTQLPIRIDGATKLLSIPSSITNNKNNKKDDDLDLPTLKETLDTINTIHTNLKSLDTTTTTNTTSQQTATATATATASSTSSSTPIPPAPSPTNLTTQKRTAHITKLRDSASLAYKKSQFTESVRLYSVAVDGARGRPAWEPVGLIREELSVLYRDRALGYMARRCWVEGWKDCEASVECKRPQGNSGGGGGDKAGKAAAGSVAVWGRGGRCLVEMGRYEEAVRWLERGVDCEGAALRQGEDGREVKMLLDEARRKVEVIPGGVR